MGNDITNLIYTDNHEIITQMYWLSPLSVCPALPAMLQTFCPGPGPLYRCPPLQRDPARHLKTAPSETGKVKDSSEFTGKFDFLQILNF